MPAPTPPPPALPTFDLDFWRSEALLGGTISGDYYPADGESLGPVVIDGTQSGVGAVTGGVVGGISGSSVGGRREAAVVGVPDPDDQFRPALHRLERADLPGRRAQRLLDEHVQAAAHRRERLRVLLLDSDRLVQFPAFRLRPDRVCLLQRKTLYQCEHGHQAQAQDGHETHDIGLQGVGITPGRSRR